MSNPRQLSPAVNISFPERSTFLLPAILVWASLAIFLTSRKQNLDFVSIIAQIESKSVRVVVGLTLLGVFTVFLLGHVIDLLSQLIYERLLADKLDGFPHERIVPVSQTTGRYSRFVMRKRTNLKLPSFFFEGAKLLIASSVLITLVKIVERYPDFRQSPKLLVAFDWLLSYGYLALNLSLLLALPAILMRYAPVFTWAKRKQIAERLLRKVRKARRTSTAYQTIGYVAYLLAALIIGPMTFAYDIVDRLVRGIFRLNYEIDQLTFERFQAVIRKRLDLEWKAIQNNDRFWIPYLLLHYAKPELLKPIQSIRAASCFCRNQAFACMTASLLLAGTYRMNQVEAPDFLTKSDMIHLSLLLFFVGWIFHWRFLQQYYAFTKMTFRAVASIDQVAGSPRKKKVEKATANSAAVGVPS